MVLRCRCRINIIVTEHESVGSGHGEGGFSSGPQKPLSDLCLE